jgi:hypothetical protein
MRRLTSFLRVEVLDAALGDTVAIPVVVNNFTTYTFGLTRRQTQTVSGSTRAGRA